MVEVASLGRRFGRGSGAVVALRDVNLEVAEGEVVGVLGVNGAGKTTLIKILSTLLLPSTGYAAVAGHDVTRDVRRVREQLAVVLGGDRGLYPRLPAIDNVRFFGALKGLSRREVERRGREWLERLGLADAAHRPVETFSKGMRQRLHLAIGLLETPRVMLLDEPTVGLDPIEAQRLRDTIAGLGREGVTIVLTSHYLADIEQLASRVALLQDGRISHDLPLEQFIGLAQAVAVVTISGRGPLPDLPGPPAHGRHDLMDPGTVTESENGWEVRYRIRRWSPDTLEELARSWPASTVTGVSVDPVTLEAVFADLAGIGRERASGA
jgi:ABC-2 type transport system ATP-binding protein